jgi:hypothetical protein
MSSNRKKYKPTDYRPQALFQDGSDLPLFTGYNPQPESQSAPANHKAPSSYPGEHSLYAESEWTRSLPVYRTTRVLPFYPNKPDAWGNLSGEPVDVYSGVWVRILMTAPHDPDKHLVEHEGRYVWTCWVAAV